MEENPHRTFTAKGRKLHRTPERMVHELRVSVAGHFKNLAAMNVAVIQHAPEFFTTEQLIAIQDINRSLNELATSILKTGGARVGG